MHLARHHLHLNSIGGVGFGWHLGIIYPLLRTPNSWSVVGANGTIKYFRWRVSKWEEWTKERTWQGKKVDARTQERRYGRKKGRSAKMKDAARKRSHASHNGSSWSLRLYEVVGICWPPVARVVTSFGSTRRSGNDASRNTSIFNCRAWRSSKELKKILFWSLECELLCWSGGGSTSKDHSLRFCCRCIYVRSSPLSGVFIKRTKFWNCTIGHFEARPDD